jgi:hypothetical protein
MLDKYEEISEAQGDQEMVHELIEMGRQAGLPEELSKFLITQDIKVKNNKESKENWKANLKSKLYENFISVR